MKRWCPNTQKVCEDGYLPMEEFPCLYWNETDDVCLMLEAIRHSYDGFKLLRRAIREDPELAKKLRELDW